LLFNYYNIPKIKDLSTISNQGGIMEIKIIEVKKPAEVNVILGQSHFIKTIEDLYEVIVSTNPQAKFGIAFCESSGAVFGAF
jgi:hypothetical protein